MRNKLVCSAIVLMLNLGAALGQTVSELETKYGRPVNAYSVGEHIWMTPEYAAGGQVCRMRLYPKRISGDTNYLSKDLPFEKFNKAVEGLVPLNMRGAKAEPFGNGLWMFWGSVRMATFKYERVTITYSAGVGGRADLPKESQKESEPFDLFLLDISNVGMRTGSFGRSEDDFLPYHNSTAEVVTITWNDRECSGQ